MGDMENSVKIVVYKKIVVGDLSKFTATSNLNPEDGGGARDLRFNPGPNFFKIFKRMFTEKSPNLLKGKLYWDNHDPTDVEIFGPTRSRPNEIRLARIHECFPESYIPTSAEDCILLLIYNSDNKVYPYFTTEKSLLTDGWHESVKNPILAGLHAERPAKTTPMGYIDIENKEVYTNGK